MKKLLPTELACYELENLKLDNLVSHHVSETHSPCLVMKREPRLTGTIMYCVYIASPVNNLRLCIKQFHSLSDFTLWICTNITYKDYVCLNYTHLTA